MCAVALVPQLLCSSVAPFLCSCVGDDPTHDLKRYSGPHTTSRSQPGATQAPNTPTHTPHTQSRAAHQTPHHVEITTRVNTSPQHPYPHTPHMISSGITGSYPRSRSQSGGTELPTPCRDAQLIARQGPKHHCPHPRRTTAPQQPDNAFLHTRQRPLHTTESPTHATPTRDVPRHPSNPTSLSSTHANTPHTTQTPGQANPPAPATTQTPGQANPPVPATTQDPTHQPCTAEGEHIDGLGPKAPHTPIPSRTTESPAPTFVSTGPFISGAAYRTRTDDLLFTRQLLYQLS